MKKAIFTLVFGAFCFQCATANTIQWGTSVVISDHLSVALTNTDFADGTTALVQLIYVGADNTIDVANQLEKGVTGDDEVIAYAWIGLGGPPLPTLVGLFTGPNATNEKPIGSLYYIRAWEAPAASVGTGFVPQGDTYYGNSETYAIKYSDQNDVFDNTTSFNTNIAIPEPTVAAFIGIFGGGMLITRRLFSKQA